MGQTSFANGGPPQDPQMSGAVASRASVTAKTELRQHAETKQETGAYHSVASLPGSDIALEARTPHLRS